MFNFFCLDWLPSRQVCWNNYSLEGINIEVRPRERHALPGTSSRTAISPHLWGQVPLTQSVLRKAFDTLSSKLPSNSSEPFPVHAGYSEARDLFGQGSVADLRKLSLQARDLVTELFAGVDGGFADHELYGDKEGKSLGTGRPRLVPLKLSSQLEQWKQEQHRLGNILPPKGTGLSRVSPQILKIFGAEHWPEAMQTNNALFGCGIASLLIGAADVRTMFSNYVTDMVFYYEHGYNYVFPSLDRLLHQGLTDRHALRTLGGRQRRQAVCIGKDYIQAKIGLEDEYKHCLKDRAAQLDRRAAQIISLSESSLLGMAAESVARGFDPAAVMSDLVFSSPGTDVVDVGCDLVNSEVMNSFLNVSDITRLGIVSEEVLRRVYDAYAATGARMLTQRWHEPVARMCAALYTWHIHNDRHMFLRRAILGWPKARKTPAQPQCEADFDEVFDEDYHATGFSRALPSEYACNGDETCDHVRRFLRHHQDPLLRELWWSLVTGVLAYVRQGKVDAQHEEYLAEASRLCMAQLFSRGSVLEMVWLIAHANHHAWQVNYLFEAAMFGSILDGGELIGKLDRQENADENCSTELLGGSPGQPITYHRYPITVTQTIVS
ncbi:hypothetical protein E4U09_001926 [Claviceps aff. purpurea]|uniref:Uncharacterized protein n=1 Tax=Claviceps aff. purpurea TaxID=1967640 RepID=A0A9P7QNK8_9HYPO|nr:hypothetical protein E4U09_001926 [Claviceps aff. purpurea]